MSLRKHSVLAAASGVAFVLATGCLFETTAPKRPVPNPTPGPENQSEVTGLVQHVDARDNHVRNMPDRVVRARWYRYRESQHMYELIKVTTVRSGNGGSYRMVYADPNIGAVEVDGLRCDVSSSDTNVEDCFLAVNDPRCAIWTRSTFISLAPGAHVQAHVRVPCAVVP